MASGPYGEIEELTLCSCCKRVFDDGDRLPKLLVCKHHFCLSCARSVLGKGRDVCCAHCWQRTELQGGRAEALPTHAAVLALARRLSAGVTLNTAPSPPAAVLPQLSDIELCVTHALPALWCNECAVHACHACTEHATHALRHPHEARALLARDSRDLIADLQRLAVRQRDFLLRALEAATALKVRLEAELAAPTPTVLERARITDTASISLPVAAAERDRLRGRRAEAVLQCRLDDLIRNATVPLDFELLRRALAGLTAGDAAPPAPPAAAPDERRDSVLFLANYCTAQLYTRHCLAARARRALTNGAGSDLIDGGILESDSTGDSGASPAPLVRIPGTMLPRFYFQLAVDGTIAGRVVIEVRADVAPRMARNFGALTTGELGVGYRGCTVFQCWDGESVITGDFELNNGRGGRSVFEESYFMPDDTRLAAVRGAVGMRRSQKRHDNLGLVGSQFRIVLREMRGFTAIFGFVVEGLELVDSLSRTGDSAGKPQSTILISGCGKLT